MDDPSLCGERYAGDGPVDDGCIDEQLQVLDMLADGRLGQPHPARGAREVPFRDEMDEGFELLHGDVLELVIFHDIECT
jgi:hypothetical protein